MADYFLANPPKNPKADIAEYVKKELSSSSIVKIPHIERKLKNAKNLDMDFIARLAVSQDYAGASNLFPSPFLEDCPDAKSNRDFINCVMNTKDEGDKDSVSYKDFLDKTFCSYLGLDVNDFTKNIDVSFWEYIPGFNHKVVEDTAIQGKYHIFTSWGGKNCSKSHYAQIKGRFILDQVGNTLPRNVNLIKLVNAHKEVDSLSKFDKTDGINLNEYQTSFEERIYFLQALKTQKPESATFTLNRSLEDGEFEAYFSRGVTKTQEDEISTIALLPYSKTYHDEYNMLKKDVKGLCLPNITHPSSVLLESVVDDLSFSALISQSKDFSAAYMQTHVGSSAFFKSKLGVVLPMKFFDALGEKAYESFARDEAYITKIRVAADGNKTYVKLLD